MASDGSSVARGANGAGGQAADVVVVGCGVAGAWTALLLARTGVGRIVVLDQANAGAGASTRGTGLIRVHHANAFETGLAHISSRYYRDWDDHVGIGSSGWRNTGVMWMVAPSNVEMLRRNAATQRSLGAEVQVLDPEEIRVLQPHIDPEGVGAAVYEPGSGTAIGAAVIDGLVSRLLAEGVTVRTYTPALRLLRNSSVVTGVETPEGPLRADRVVLAAGAWSRALARSAGVDIPLAATRVTLGTAYYPPRIDPAIAFFDEVTDCSFAPKKGGTWAIVPVRDAQFLVTVNPDDFETRPLPGAAEAGLALLSRRIPAMRDAVLGDRWAAVDGVTPDRRPLIGEHPELPGLFLHVGGNFKGFKMAPVGALGLVAHMTGASEPEVDVSAYSVSRFDHPSTRPWDESRYVNSRWT